MYTQMSLLKYTSHKYITHTANGEVHGMLSLHAWNLNPSLNPKVNPKLNLWAGRTATYRACCHYKLGTTLARSRRRILLHFRSSEWRGGEREREKFIDNQEVTEGR